jgi:hypothetical protein
MQDLVFHDTKIHILLLVMTPCSDVVKYQEDCTIIQHNIITQKTVTQSKMFIIFNLFSSLIFIHSE